MNPAHLHLIVNHGPLFFILTGTLALAVTFKTKSRDLRIFATVLFLLAAISAVASHITGDGAEHAVKEISGLAMDVVKPAIHEHEKASDFSLWTSVIVAVASVGLLWTAHNKPKHLKKAQIIVLVLALHSLTVQMRVAYLGGLIRHTEIKTGS